MPAGINTDPTHHPSLHLLAIERTGWKRWILGRWAYSSEPFRRDIQRRLKACGFQQKPNDDHEQLFQAEDF